MRLIKASNGKTKITLSKYDDSGEQPSLKSTMINYLKSTYGSEDEWQNDAEVAIYFFARDYHTGQNSELYSILSTSPYRPGPITTIDSEGDLVKMMYEDLAEKFS